MITKDGNHYVYNGHMDAYVICTDSIFSDDKKSVVNYSIIDSKKLPDLISKNEVKVEVKQEWVVEYYGELDVKYLRSLSESAYRLGYTKFRIEVDTDSEEDFPNSLIFS